LIPFFVDNVRVKITFEPYFIIGLIPHGQVGKERIYKTYWYGKRLDKYYYPNSPMTGKQQGWRSVFYDGTQNWLGFDAATKNFYNALKYPPHMKGLNRYLRLYLKGASPMIIYWDSLEKNAGDPALIPDYIASPYFTSDLYPAAAKKLLALGPSGDLVLPKKLEVSGKVGFGMSGATHEVHLLESGSAISGTDVDISELGFVIHNLENVNGLAVGLGFAQTSEMSNVGAAIIFERTGSQSQGSLHFATKNTSGIGDDISIKMTIDKDGNISIISGNFTIIDGNLTVADNKDIKFDSGAKIERSDGHIVLTPEEDKLVKVAIIRRDYTTNTYKK